MIKILWDAFMLRLRHTLLITLALISLVLPACLPFLQVNLPRSDDGHLHLYRIIALDDAWSRDGHLYPRYASNLVYGYGAPLFNYFPPVAYMPGASLHRLGLSYIQSFQAMMIGALFLAATGMYLLASSTWTDQQSALFAGFGAAALYVYSPYLLFDAVGRGTLTEVVALSVLPWVLWALIKMASERAWRAMPLRLWCFTGFLALFIPLHNVVTLHGSLLIGVIGLALLWRSPNPKWLFASYLVAGLMALLMSLFFLAPALLEGGAVKIRAVTDALSFIDVTRTLRPLGELFALPHTADPTNLQPSIPISYGWSALILAVIGLWRLRREKTLRPLIVALLLIFGLTLVLMWDTPIGAWLWRTIPLLDYTQFAWRVLGIGSLALAWLGGWGLASVLGGARDNENVGARHAIPSPKSVHQSLIWIGFLTLSLLYGLPWTIARHEPLAATSILDAQEHERISGELALSSYSEYLPTDVETPPDPNRLREAFASGQPVPRLHDSEGITVKSSEWGGTQGLITFEAEQPTTLVFDWLYVPGWEARFTNDEAANLSVSVKPYAPHGLVSVEVPAGAYTLEIALQETPLQQKSTLISVLTWVFWAIIGIALVGAQRAAPASELTSDLSTRAWHAIPLQTMIVCLSIVLFKIAVIDQTQNLWHSERYLNNIQPSAATFADQILLREYTLGARAVRAGEDLSISIVWQTGQIPTRDESSLIELRNAQGFVAATGGSFQPGGLAMTHWQSGTYVIENTLLSIPADVPPGNYTVTLGLYDPITKEQRSVLNADGNPQDVKFTLGDVTVIRPAAPLSIESPTPAFSGLAFGGISTPLPIEVSPGQEFVFDPAWIKLGEIDLTTQMRVGWLRQGLQAGDVICGFGPSDVEFACADRGALVPMYPLDQWQVGDVWRGITTVFVPGQLGTGDYKVWVDLVIQLPQSDVVHSDVIGTIELGTMHVTAPERTSVLPDDLNEHTISWVDGIALRGYTGSIDDFTLYWKISRPVQANLRLSVQIIDENEKIIAQQDGVPVNWTRPVAGWAVDEVIATSYEFDVPEGEYHVRLVWYDGVTGERVKVSDGKTESVMTLDNEE